MVAAMKGCVTHDSDAPNPQRTNSVTKANFGRLLGKWLSRLSGDGPRPVLGNLAKVRGRLFIRF